MFGQLRARQTPIKYPAGTLMFVYGTLMEGEANHWLLKELINKGHACAVSANARCAGLTLVEIGGLPAGYWTDAGELHENYHVVGELYRVTAEAAELVDLFEGHPNFYSRRKLIARYKPGDNEQAEEKSVGAYYYRGPLPGGGARAGYKDFCTILYHQKAGSRACDWKKRLDNSVIRAAGYFRGPEHVSTVAKKKGEGVVLVDLDHDIEEIPEDAN